MSTRGPFWRLYRHFLWSCALFWPVAHSSTCILEWSGELKGSAEVWATPSEIYLSRLRLLADLGVQPELTTAI